MKQHPDSTSPICGTKSQIYVLSTDATERMYCHQSQPVFFVADSPHISEGPASLNTRKQQSKQRPNPMRSTEQVLRRRELNSSLFGQSRSQISDATNCALVIQNGCISLNTRVFYNEQLLLGADFSCYQSTFVLPVKHCFFWIYIDIEI